MKQVLALAALALTTPSALTVPEKGFAEMNTDLKKTLAHSYADMWVTADGRVRHNLLPNGRYDEARGNRESAYQGCYEIDGNHIEYWDDTGFTADGDFIDDVLHHGGMVLYRRGKTAVK